MINEFTIADLAMEHLGSYEQKDYQFAMALLSAQEAQVRQEARVQAIGEAIVIARQWGSLGSQFDAELRALIGKEST